MTKEEVTNIIDNKSFQKVLDEIADLLEACSTVEEVEATTEKILTLVSVRSDLAKLYLELEKDEGV